MKFQRGHIRAGKLTPSQVLEIREKHALGRGYESLGREYEVSSGQIGRICRGDAWKQFHQPRSEREIEAEMILRPTTPPVSGEEFYKRMVAQGVIKLSDDVVVADSAENRRLEAAAKARDTEMSDYPVFIPPDDSKPEVMDRLMKDIDSLKKGDLK